MNKNEAISKKGLQLLKTFEGFRSSAIQLPNGIWVIGHGHTASARKGGIVNHNDAEQLLVWDMNNLIPKVMDSLFAPVSQAQLDALLSLAFNIGMHNFSNSDVVRYINEGNLISAAAAFDVWRRAKLGTREMVLDALVRRRAAEKAHFLDVTGTLVLAPSARVQPKSDAGLAAEIERETIEQTQSQGAIEVSIDLSSSAALGSLLNTQFSTSDSMAFSLDQDTGSVAIDEPSITYSDDDIERESAEILPQPDPELEDEPVNQSGGHADPQIATEVDLVPIGNVFGEQNQEQTEVDNPVREVAERITGRLSNVAAAVEELPELSHAEPDLQEETDDIPPLTVLEDVAEQVEIEEQSEFEAVDQSVAVGFGDFPYDEQAELPPLPEEGHLAPAAIEDELTPEELSNETFSDNEQPFEVLEKRNTGMFALMGIIGLILTAGGVFETRQSGFVVTLWDALKGPGLAGLGILLILVSIYFLAKRKPR
ncbi:MAG: hypothetical protein COA47_02245 [Robiginitomaculum sp.]|nr:MAG: hypothetical protein COA47_02245 [Robiginitomaculum sp.]